ncbi:MAG TPA: antibiotic biosynthesis monooxygenase family protein [Ktedonobacterales bacterium]|nr:antibiotic biosynthesis monooxygenase family protein [Ktedonobacterales bacterium]
MVLEIAEYTARPGKADELVRGLLAGREIIQRAQGCRGVTLRRCLEDDARCIFTIEWETLEDHTERFRGSPAFQEYRNCIAGLYVDPIVARHYASVSAG